MKNREKYKNELMEVINTDGRICRFVKNHGIAQMLGKDIESYCKMTCVTCGTALQLWLDEEYEEPPKPEVDWSKVPVDTLVRVRDNEGDEWVLRYFDSFEDENFRSMSGHNYRVFADGATSVTGREYVEQWKYCELVKDENNGSN